MKSFKQFVEQKQQTPNKEWKSEYINLSKGFIPPKNMAPIIQAFLDSGNIELTNDISNSVTMPKKSLFLVGGPVRDFLINPSKRSKDYDLATNATPEQIALILHNAGFKVPSKFNRETKKLEADYDRSGKSNENDTAKIKEMNISFKPELQNSSNDKIWFLKGRDSSGERKPFVIGAVVNGEVFEIATFRKDEKTINGQSEVDFVDNPKEDAERRDLTINAMYIELTKPDGENKKLYDPTKKGYHDVYSGTVRTVGEPSKRFEEDKIRVMRAIRFHCKFGNSQKMDKEMEKQIPNFSNLEGVAMERIREEFLKGLDDPEVDPKKYIFFYRKFGLLSKVFPGLNTRTDVPSQLRNKKDRFIALAWILQDNPISKINSVLGRFWSKKEKATISYLISLREFNIDDIEEFLKQKRIYGITKDQIIKWVDMFDVVEGGSIKSTKPSWSKKIRRFADFEPDRSKLVKWYSDETKQEIHPEILSRKIEDIPIHFRGSAIKDINRKKLKDMFYEKP